MRNLRITIAVVTMSTAAILALAPLRNASGAPPVPVIQTTQRSAVITGVIPGNLGIIDAYCLAGETVTGGGFRWGELQSNGDFAVLNGQQADVARTSQYTEVSPLAWRVAVLNTGTVNIDIEADVMCTKIVR